MKKMKICEDKREKDTLDACPARKIISENAKKVRRTSCFASSGAITEATPLGRRAGRAVSCNGNRQRIARRTDVRPACRK